MGEEDFENDGDDTIDLDDANDEDYIPDLTELGKITTEGDNVQIKVEVMDDFVNDRYIDKKGVTRKKSDKEIIPSLIPAMVSLCQLLVVYLVII